MFAKTTDKTAWKIISDPVAEERQWLAAAQVVGDKAVPAAKEPLLDRVPDTAHAALSGVCGLMASLGLLFIAFTVMNSMGAALAIDDAATTFSDWLRATIWAICIPSTGAAVMGYVQRPHAAETRHLWLIPIVPWTAVAMVLGMYLLGPVAILIAVAGFAVARATFLLGREVAKWWQRHKSPHLLMGPALPFLYGFSALLWVYLLSTFNVDSGPHEATSVESGWFGIQFFGIATAVFALLGSVSCGSKQLSTRLAATFTMQAPLLCFYAVCFTASIVYGAYSFATRGSFPLEVPIVSVLSIALTTASTTFGTTTAWLCRRR